MNSKFWGDMTAEEQAAFLAQLDAGEFTNELELEEYVDIEATIQDGAARDSGASEGSGDF